MASVFLGDLNDFIAPSQACVNPLFAAPAKPEQSSQAPADGAAKMQLVLENDDPLAVGNIAGWGATEPNLIKASGTKTATVSLNDCLACSGCVTSAETVLITQQSASKFLASIRSGTYKVVVVTVSAQSRASLAAQFGMTPLELQSRLTSLFRGLGAHYVLDASVAADISLLEARQEFVHRYRSSAHSPAPPWRRPPTTIAMSADQQMNLETNTPEPVWGAPASPADGSAGPQTGGGSPVPMLISSCPGWVCYAEKTVPEAVPFMSTAKSPQQAMGSLVKGVLPRLWGVAPAEVLHATLMMCYDKKLEAARKDFFHEDIDAAEVDLVLTTGEVLDLMGEQAEAQGLASPRAFLDTLAPVPPLVSGGAADSFTARMGSVSADGRALLANVEGDEKSGSGGYLEHVFRHAAKELFAVDLSGQALQYRQGRNPDFQEVSLEVDGKTVLNFALAYGFRNIQSVVTKMKRSRSPYHLVEVMACPSGCVNGGGQIRDKTETPQQVRDRVQTVRHVLHQVQHRPPEENPLVQAVYTDVLQAGPFSDPARRLFHTTYHAVPKMEMANPAMAAW